MGIFDNLKSGVTKLSGNITSEVKKFQNKNFLNAMIAGSALVANADGKVDAGEKQKMVAFISTDEALRNFDTNEVIDLFDYWLKQLEFDASIGEINVLKALGKIGDDAVQCKTLVRVVCAIASSDGDFDDNEKDAVRKIINEFGLKESDFL